MANNPIQSNIDNAKAAYASALPLLLLTVDSFVGDDRYRGKIALEVIEYNILRLEKHSNRLSGVLPLTEQPNFIAIIETIVNFYGEEAPQYLDSAFGVITNGPGLFGQVISLINNLTTISDYTQFMIAAEYISSVMKAQYDSDIFAYENAREQMLDQAFDTNTGNLQANPTANEFLSNLGIL